MNRQKVEEELAILIHGAQEWNADPFTLAHLILDFLDEGRISPRDLEEATWKQ